MVHKGIKVCCLGGGPGTDVIGVMAALRTVFYPFEASATVIDYMKEWEYTFHLLLRELSCGFYGAAWQNITYNLQWKYVGANLLDNMTNEVNKSLGAASFVTMVKFLSAVSCTNAEQMLEKIFSVMKPGALVLFIDNAAGGFTELVEKTSMKFSFETIMPALRHAHYENINFRNDRFGHTSCFKTTVTILLLRKPFKQSKNVVPASLLPDTSSPVEKPIKENSNQKLTNPHPLSVEISKENDDSKKNDSVSCQLTIKEENLESNSVKLCKEKDNLNHNLEKTDTDSHELSIKEEKFCKETDNLNYNFEKTDTDSHELPIKEENLNNELRKTDPCSVELNKLKDSLNHNTKKTESVPPKLPIKEDINLNGICREIGLNANNILRVTECR